ncbi:MAG: hypothetical protein FWE62_05505 [Firmicutes bacterium]|nr:hypothetical protein [Bacillota bacterium]
MTIWTHMSIGYGNDRLTSAKLLLGHRSIGLLALRGRRPHALVTADDK